MINVPVSNVDLLIKLNVASVKISRMQIRNGLTNSDSV